MSSRYPVQIDTSTTLPIVADNFSAVNGATVNRLRDAIVNVETELGIKPSGTSGTLRARLDSFDTIVNDLTNKVFQANGDLTGNYSTQTVVGIQGRPISALEPFDGYTLDWNGSTWIPTNSLSLNQFSANQLTLNGVSAPSVSSSSKGIIYFDSTDNKFKFSENGNTYQDLSLPVATIVVGVTGSGAKYECDGTNDDVQINAAIVEASALNNKAIVKLLPGSYYVSAPIELKSNVILEGSGAGATKVIAATGYSASYYYVIGASGAPTTSTNINLTSDANQGDTTIQLTAGTEFNSLSVDDYVFLASDGYWETTNLSLRKIGEYVRIASIVGSNITTYGMVRDNYTVADNARIYRISFIENCGVRDLEILQEEPLTSRTGNPPPHISLQYTTNSFVENCFVHKNDGPGITVYQSLNINIKNCIIQDLTDNTSISQLGYGLLIGGASQSVTVNACKFNRLRHGVDCGPSRAPSSVVSNNGIPRGVSVVNNVVTNASNAAYSTHSEGENFSFVGNVASNCENFGFFMRAKGCRIISNTVEWCSGGIGIGNASYNSSGGSAAGSHVVSNTIRHIKKITPGSTSGISQTGEGIILALTDNVLVHGNTIEACDEGGIRLKRDTIRCTISNNTILNCYVANDGGSSQTGIVLDGNLSGTSASITSVIGSDVTITGLINMDTPQVGRTIVISGASTSANNGSFTITAVNSSISVTYTNASGAAPDANNGSISYYVEGSTDNVIVNNIVVNTSQSRYDRSVIGHMQYAIRDYGGTSGGNVRNIYKNNTGIGMEAGLMIVNNNSYSAGNSLNEATPAKSITTTAADSLFLSTPLPGTFAVNSSTGRIYFRTEATDTWGDVIHARGSTTTLPVATLQFSSSLTNPAINIASTSSGNGQNLQLTAQSSTAAVSIGGNLILSAGSGTSSNGVVRIAVTGNTGVQITPSNSAQSIYNIVSGATSVLFNQSSNSTASATGATWTVQAQNATGTTSNGGKLVLTSGTGTSLHGATQIQVGGNTLIEATNIATGQNIVALAKKSAITTTQMPANTGDGVVYLANAATSPTANPVSGCIIWSDNGVVNIRQTDGNVVTLQTAVQDSVGLRLTLTSATPITSSDVTAASTLYFTPFISDRIDLYNGTSWQTRRTNEIYLALTGLTSDRNYDVFAYDNSGTVTLELSAAWNADNITRTDAITRQNGILVKSSNTTRRYIGTIRTTGTTTTEDSKSKRFVWNYYNKVSRQLLFQESTNSWSLANGAFVGWRQLNNGASNAFVDAVIGGLTGDTCRVKLILTIGTIATANDWVFGFAIGVDSTTVNSAKIYGSLTSASDQINTAIYDDYQAIGYHRYYPLESTTVGGGPNVTVYGDAGFPQTIQFGLLGEING